MSLSVRLNPTVVVVAAFLAVLIILTSYMIRDESHERSLKSMSGRLGQTESALRNVDGKLSTALDVEKNLQNDLRVLEKQNADKQLTLTEEVERVLAANRALTQDMDRLHAQHAESLAAERKHSGQVLASTEEESKQKLAQLRRETQAALDEFRQTSAQELEMLRAQHAESLTAERRHAEQRLASAEEEYQQKLAQVGQETQAALDETRQSSIALQEQLDLITRKNGSLVEEINALNADFQDTRVQYASQVQKLSEKLAHYRTALEGSDPARLEQLANLELEMQRSQEALTAAQLDQQAREADYGKRLADADLIIQQTQETLDQTRLKLENSADELEKTRAELATARHEAVAEIERLSELRAQDQAAVVQAQQEIAELTSVLENERTNAKQLLEALQQAHATEFEQAKSNLEATERQLVDTRDELEDTRQEAEACRQAAEKEYMVQMEQANGEISALNQAMAEQEAETARALEALEAEYTREEARLNAELADSERRLQQSLQAYSALENLHSQFAKLNGQYTERGIRLTVTESELRFPGGKYTLPSKEIESLDEIARFLNENATLNVLVEGHTDSGGSESFNLILSQKRAEAVKKAMVERGVAESRIQAKGFGETQPVASNQTYNGRRQNRRVEIFIIEG